MYMSKVIFFFLQKEINGLHPGGGLQYNKCIYKYQCPEKSLVLVFF